MSTKSKRRVKYETPQIETCKSEEDDILTVSPGDVLEDDTTGGEIS